MKLGRDRDCDEQPMWVQNCSWKKSRCNCKSQPWRGGIPEIFTSLESFKEAEASVPVEVIRQMGIRSLERSVRLG